MWHKNWDNIWVMANTPSSLEVQIDNFLEHFKRSASKAMDTDWITTEQSPNYATTATTAASYFHSSPLKTAKARSSCFDISQLSSITGTVRQIWIKPTIKTMAHTMENHPKTKLQYVGYLFVIDRWKSINSISYRIHDGQLVSFNRIDTKYSSK